MYFVKLKFRISSNQQTRQIKLALYIIENDNVSLTLCIYKHAIHVDTSTNKTKQNTYMRMIHRSSPSLEKQNLKSFATDHG